MTTLISEDDVFDFLEIDVDENAIATSIHLASEKFVSNFCNRTFSATDYKEFYNGTGSQKLLLKNYPILNIKRVSLGTVVPLQIYNTNKYTSAVVTVTSTGITLEYNDVKETVDLSFVTNTTLSALATAVGTIGKGWTANLLSDYGTVVSTELLENVGQSAINSTYVDLLIPSTQSINVRADLKSGIIYLPTETQPYLNLSESPLFLRDHTRFIESNEGDFRVGFNNIFVKYRAGYEEDELPDDLRFAILAIIKDLYGRHQEESLGVSSYTIPFVLEKILDPEITKKIYPILKLYKKFSI